MRENFEVWWRETRDELAQVKSWVNGKIEDKEAMIKTLKTVKFNSVRGDFRFNTNQYPIQNYYLREIVKDGQGRLVNRIVGQPLLANHGDAYVKDCPMK